jgi:hypothetical protein
MLKPSILSKTKLIQAFCIPINDSRLDKFRDVKGNITASGYITIKKI